MNSAKTEENNREGKTRDLFKKIGDIKESFYAKMDMTKDKNIRDLTEAEDIHQEEMAIIHRGIISERSGCPGKHR